MPFELPFSLLNKSSLALFNAAYFQRKKQLKTARRVPYQSFFYPLDGVRNWNRLYGPAGLYQHQSIIPFDAARTIIPAMLEASRVAGQVSFLTVLKRFGSVKSPGLMSFPMPGYTLTMDFPNRGGKTLELLDRLDRMTVEAGGRVNPYKDHRMSAEVLLQVIRVGALSKLFATRLSTQFLAPHGIDARCSRLGNVMKYIPFILFTVMTNAAAQLMLKYGMLTLGPISFSAETLIQRMFQIVFNPWIFAGLLTFVISMASHLYVLSKVDLSFAYPFLSLAYVAVALFAWLLFKEELGAYKIAGIAFICIGTVLIAQSGKSSEPPAEANIKQQTHS